MARIFGVPSRYLTFIVLGDQSLLNFIIFNYFMKFLLLRFSVLSRYLTFIALGDQSLLKFITIFNYFMKFLLLRLRCIAM